MECSLIDLSIFYSSISADPTLIVRSLGELKFEHQDGREIWIIHRKYRCSIKRLSPRFLHKRSLSGIWISDHIQFSFHRF